MLCPPPPPASLPPLPDFVHDDEVDGVFVIVLIVGKPPAVAFLVEAGEHLQARQEGRGQHRQLERGRGQHRQFRGQHRQLERDKGNTGSWPQATHTLIQSILTCVYAVGLAAYQTFDIGVCGGLGAA